MMARIVVEIRFAWRGLDQFISALQSVGEAMSNAHSDAAVDLDFAADGATSMGMRIARVDYERQGGLVTAVVSPTPSIILFAAAIMASLPSRASIAWRDGWPHIHCPPNEDRDVDDDPTPLVPNELVPA